MIAELADQVVLIQRPLLLRIWSHLIRIVSNDGRHPEISTLADTLFIKTIVKRWRKKENKSMREFAEQYRSKLIILKSFDEIDRYFKTLMKS